MTVQRIVDTHDRHGGHHSIVVLGCDGPDCTNTVTTEQADDLYEWIDVSGAVDATRLNANLCSLRCFRGWVERILTWVPTS